MSEETLPFVRLNLVPGLGPGRIDRLVRRFGGPAAALAASPESWAETGCPLEVARAALSEECLRAAEAEMDRAASLGARILTPGDPSYPEPYRRIPLSPPVLYARGRVELLAGETAAVAIVGSRTPTGYGREMAHRLASGVAAAGFVVVSGLARGIDSAAHRGALDVGGRTVAALASGFERPYPTEDPDLPARIEAEGVLLTEFPLAVPARKGHFPRRNRLISGLALGTLVVEAAGRSGSLLTAQWALDQNRSVMAVPGRADNQMARGSNGLLRRGAALIEEPEDILREIGGSVPAAAEPEEPLLASIGPGATVDELCDATGRPAEDLFVELLRLEIAGRIRRCPGGIYRANEAAAGGERSA
ncbi:MAG TPA: DNA-processing protein DprA [Planctomycetota bacterium]|jgi:DNA processing protein|nr:DNA-processing protein DprA [Planctomycetota bacterium]